MASVILGVAGAAIPGVGPIVSAIGGTIGGIIDSKLGILGRPQALRSPDVQIALAGEGTPGTLVLGARARVPLHTIYATPLVRRRETNRIDKRATVATETIYANLVTVAAFDYLGAFDQILAEGKRIWIGDPALNIDSTARATPTAGTILTYRAYLTPGATQWVVEFTLEPTQDGSGNPQTGSPDFSVFDVGGRCGLLLDSITINGAGTLVDPDDYWEVIESRILDAAGNSRLRLRAFLPTTGSPPLFSWAGKFTGATANAGVTIGVRGRLVRTDPRSFPFAGGGVARFIDAKSTLMQSYLGTANTPKPRRVEIIDLKDLCLSGYGNRVPQLEAIVEALDDDGGGSTGVDARTLAGALKVLLERWAGLSTGLVSLAGVDTATELSGLVMNSPFAPADALLRMTLAHDLVWQEGSGGDFRGFARVIHAEDVDTVEVETADLNCATTEGEWGEEAIERTRIDDSERPKAVTVTFQDRVNALLQATETVPFEGIGGGQEIALDLRGVTLARDEAHSLARRVGRKAWNRIEKARIALPWHYYHVQEDDVLSLTDSDGDPVTVLVDQIHETDETIEVEGFIVDEAVADEVGGTASGLGEDRLGDTGQDPIAPGPLPLVGHVVETRPLADDHASRVGVYVGAGVAAPGTAWEPVTVFMRRPDAEWLAVGVLPRPATTGIVASALASGATSGYDTANTLSVTLDSGSLAGTTQDLCDLGQNLAIVGDEVLGFVDATDIDERNYDLETLSRGRCDTASAVGSHVDDERFLLLDDAVAFVPLAIEDVGVEIEFAFVPPGSTVDDAEIVAHTVTGAAAVPLTLTSLTLTDTSGKLDVAWVYRSLRSARFRVPTTDPTEPGETVRLQFWNTTVAGITGDPVYTVDVPAAPESFRIHDPHTRGITGPNVACRAIVRSSLAGVASAVTSDDVSATFTAVGVTDHGALSGLGDADHVAGSIAFTATDKVLGRSTAGSGAGEEIACTATGRLIIAKSSLAAVRAALSVYKHWETFVYAPSWWASVNTGTGNSYQQDHTRASWLYAAGLGGLFALETGAGTASTDSAARYQGNAGAMYLVDGGEWVFRVACNRSTSLLCRFGLRAEAPAAGHTDVTNGVYFEADTAAGSNWYGCSAAAGTRTKTSTGYALSNTNQTFQLFRIKFVDGTTGVTFSHFDTGTNAWVDDLTINTNIPTAGTNRGARAWAMIAYNGAASAKIVFDDLAWDPINGASGAVPILG